MMLWRRAVNCLRGRRALGFLLLFAVGGSVVLFHKPLSEIIQQRGAGMKLESTPQQPTEDRRGRTDKSRQTATPDPREQDIGSLHVSSTADSFSPERWKKLSDIKETRRQLIKEMCAKYKSSISKKITRDRVNNLFVEDKYKVLYCQVPKAGCTNWKRTLILLAGKAANAQNITHNDAHLGSYLRTLKTFNQEEIMHRLKTYTKVLFVREPFERVVSFYRDKFNNPNPYYHSLFGKPIISKYRKNASSEALKTGDGVTFKEFVMYLLDDQWPVGIDIHWNRFSDLCNPCLIDYDFIGKFENMEEESNFVLRMAGAPTNIKLPTFKDRNPTDKRTSSDITEEYFSQISLAERQRFYDFYYIDFLMFNYSKPFNDLF